MGKRNLQRAVEKAKKTKNAADVETALLLCLDDCGKKGLESVLELANMALYKHEGVIHKWEIKEACVITAIYWGDEGFNRLLEYLLSGDNHYAYSTIIRTLSYAASGSIDTFAEGFRKALPSLYQRLNFESGKYKSEAFIDAAKQTLIKFTLNTESNRLVPLSLVVQLSTFSTAIHCEEGQQEKGILLSQYTNSTNAFNNLFCALLTRWFRLNNKSLNSYMELIKTARLSEETVHQYLAKHPYILEPFYASIWSKVRLGESLIADFLIRLMDDSYIVVEIEKPSDTIISKNGDLSSKTNHAIRQVLEYRDWIASNELYARKRFNNIWRPSGLVVIGMEANLTPTQTARLKQENESRHGIVRVVGFDWLQHRAESIHHNIINHSFERFEI